MWQFTSLVLTRKFWTDWLRTMTWVLWYGSGTQSFTLQQFGSFFTLPSTLSKACFSGRFWGVFGFGHKGVQCSRVLFLGLEGQMAGKVWRLGNWYFEHNGLEQCNPKNELYFLHCPIKSAQWGQSFCLCENSISLTFLVALQRDKVLWSFNTANIKITMCFT